ncbi:hypothetical protein V2W30_38590 [Streptomyces sp. Q6]|uniref:Uncharacterized protein n=1 Tax=Streptomyces citrinus TaxID=3118173 RepID=A0ACD5ANR2_9ACTN
MRAPFRDRHPSLGDLALFVLGEEASSATKRHVDRCRTCRSAVAEFRRALVAGRAGGQAPTPPPASVWEAISRRL